VSALGLGWLSTPSTPHATSRASSGDDSREDDLRLAWESGELSWLLNPNQRDVYDACREWEALDPTAQPGDFPRVYVYDIGRRYGKTTIRFLMRCEDAIQRPGAIYRIASAYQRNIDEIVNDVSRYVLETCPDDLRPEYKQAKQKFVFPNGSEIRLVGLDMHPDGLRGQACDGDDLSEAAFIKGLRYAIKSVLYPQYQGRPWARIYLESSAPREAESDYDAVFVEDAKQRGAYVYRTIDDNPMLSDDEREEFIRAAGGREHHDCQREYFNVRVRDPEGSVVPEFSVSRHVHMQEVPAYAHCYVGADPGTRDKFGLVFGYWDIARAKLVIQRSWAERNAGLSDVAACIRETERELWGTADVHTSRPRWPDDLREGVPDTHVDGAPEPLRYWDGEKLCANPYRRVSDTDARTIFELTREHKVAFNAADKSHAKHAQDAGAARKIEQPKLYLLRQWLLNDRIEIWPDSGPLESQLNAGRWNEQRTDFERTPSLGHLDCLMALVYMLPAIAQNLNPNKPEFTPGMRDVFYDPRASKLDTHKRTKLVEAFGTPRLGARATFQ
jgi:hypothetical protein